jgi:uncharacterized protein (DUF1684 family)
MRTILITVAILLRCVPAGPVAGQPHVVLASTAMMTGVGSAPNGAPRPAPPARPASAYQEEILTYRAQREAELKADDGWLTVAGLFWLKPGANVTGSANGSDVRLPAKAPARIGVFELKDGKVTFTADRAAHVTSAGKPIGSQPVEAPRGDETALAVGDLRMFVIHREDRFGIRMRDLKSPMRQQFKGLRYFPIRPEYRVRAKFIPYDPPHTVAVPNVLGQNPEMQSPGYVAFTLKGKSLRLESVYEDDEKKDLFFIFKDTTSRDATYHAGRFLHADLPKDGFVTMDFNKAYNPPCAFTDFATCPLPRKENQLPVRVEAGELAYHGPTR